MIPSSRKASTFLGHASSEGRTSLLEYEAEQVARQYRIPVATGWIASTEKQAISLASKLGFPIVMKIVVPSIIHKSDVGGVELGISTYAEVKQAFHRIFQRAKRAGKNIEFKGVYVQKMVPKSYEFFVGGSRDPLFGPLIMFGMGGIFVELFRDVATRLAPVKHEEAVSMIKETRIAASLLSGFRGSRSLDLDATAHVIVRVGQMMEDLEEIESVDVNPLFVYPRGAIAVDVRILLRENLEREKKTRATPELKLRRP